MAKGWANAFHEGWLAYFKDLDTPFDNPKWAATKLLIAYLDLRPEPYLPILFLDFDKEEYLICPKEREEDIADGMAETEVGVEVPRAMSDLQDNTPSCEVPGSV